MYIVREASADMWTPLVAMHCGGLSQEESACIMARSGDDVGMKMWGLICMLGREDLSWVGPFCDQLKRASPVVYSKLFAKWLIGFVGLNHLFLIKNPDRKNIGKQIMEEFQLIIKTNYYVFTLKVYHIFVYTQIVSWYYNHIYGWWVDSLWLWLN